MARRVRISKRTPLWLLIIMLIVAVAQQRGWLGNAQQALQHNQPGTYRVVHFHDGDTISVDMAGKEERVRMIGVDTPETQDPRKPVQCFGKAASDFTRRLIGQHNVKLEADPTNQNRDRYSRLLRYVYLPDGTLVNAEIIKEGYGFAYVSFPFQKIDEFRNYEREARTAQKGLWGNCSPITNEQGQTSSNPQQ